ncbi:irregular chiasm C-roughest protein-like, partial [Tropilaelaps mercedesae]
MCTLTHDGRVIPSKRSVSQVSQEYQAEPRLSISSLHATTAKQRSAFNSTCGVHLSEQCGQLDRRELDQRELDQRELDREKRKSSHSNAATRSGVVVVVVVVVVVSWCVSIALVNVADPPAISLAVENEKVQEGDTVRFVCSAQANPSELTYRWFRNDEPIKMSDNQNVLVLERVSRRMNGETITCEVHNAIGISKSTQTLNVYYEPQFKGELAVVAAEIGGYYYYYYYYYYYIRSLVLRGQRIADIASTSDWTPLRSVYGGLGRCLMACTCADLYNGRVGLPRTEVTLTCEVDSNPRSDIVWLREGSVQVLGKQSTFVIHDMEPADAGKYICRASVPGFKEIMNEITVYVKGPPRISSPQLQYGMEGQEVHVECLIVSVPPAGRVQWEKDGLLLDIDNNHGIEMIKEPLTNGERNLLVIHHASDDDFGEYNCSAWNAFGEDSMLISVRRHRNVATFVVMLGATSGAVVIVLLSIMIIFCVRRRPTQLKGRCRGRRWWWWPLVVVSFGFCPLFTVHPPP